MVYHPQYKFLKEYSLSYKDYLYLLNLDEFSKLEMKQRSLNVVLEYDYKFLTKKMHKIFEN